MKDLTSTLQSFVPISLEEMDSVALLNRADTKYIFGAHQLDGVLEKLTQHYRILEIKGKRTNSYRTLYFDTPNYKLFRLHQNGKGNRYKVRIRKYLDSGLCYLELKFKTNKRKTIKSRLKIEDFETTLSKTSREHLEKNSPLDIDELEPKMYNQFTRLTFVHKQDPERLTIDIDLKYNKEGRDSELSNLVIAELKQEKATAQSDFVRTMKKFHIRTMRISKYCIGTILLNDDMKYNNFKPKLLAIEKVRQKAA